MAMPHWGGGRDGVAVPHHEAVTPKGLPCLLGGTAVAVTPLCPPPTTPPPPLLPHHRRLGGSGGLMQGLILRARGWSHPRMGQGAVITPPPPPKFHPLVKPHGISPKMPPGTWPRHPEHMGSFWSPLLVLPKTSQAHAAITNPPSPGVLGGAQDLAHPHGCRGCGEGSGCGVAPPLPLLCPPQDRCPPAAVAVAPAWRRGGGTGCAPTSTSSTRTAPGPARMGLGLNPHQPAPPAPGPPLYGR